MLAVHGFWSGGRLCLWAEDSDRSVKSPSQALRSVRSHPFAAAAPDLAPVGSTATGTGATDPGGGTATLLLPSVRSAPLDSPELVRLTPRREPAKGPALLPWSVPVVALDPAAALAIGTARDGEGMRGPDGMQVGGYVGGYDETRDVRYGASVRYAAELVDFARDLVERGRVLPSLVDSEDAGAGGEEGASARWRPVLQGPDLLTAQDLVAAVPPVFRAEARAPEDDRGQSPADLVSAALHALVDAAMRERLDGMSLLPKRRGRPPRQIPVAEPWVQALSGVEGPLRRRA